MNRSFHLLFDATKTQSLHNGLGQYSFNLASELIKIFDHGEQSLTILAPNGRHTLFPSHVSLKKKNYFIRSNSLIPAKIFLRKQWSFDIWHVAAQFSHFWPLDNKTPTLLTIHDLNFLREKCKKSNIDRYMKRLQKQVDRATHINTISYFSKSEIEAHIDLKGKPISVIYNGGIVDTGPSPTSLSQQLSQKISPQLSQQKKPFLFSIGECLKKKNFHVLLPLIKQYPEFDLIIAGKKETRYGDFLQKEIAEHGLTEHVKLLGPVDQSTRHWLYQNCKAFLFPSLTEGFGLPIIEAFHYKKPVFCSNLTSLPEIGGDHAFYWDNFDENHICSVFSNGMAMFSNDIHLGENAKQYAQQYTWDKTAKEYFDLYQKIGMHMN